MRNKIQNLADIVIKSQKCTVLTGAGVSTLSGLPDFRGSDGIYKDPDSERMFDLDLFLKDPTFFYSRAAKIVYSLHKRTPSLVHTTLAEMEKAGLVQSVVTQNIDMLHQKAGSKRVLELHGSPEVHTCIGCRKRFTYKQVYPSADVGLPFYCTVCAKPVKPNITFFGEALPEDVFSQAQDDILSSDLLLVLGTSLTVYPAASLPETAVKNGCRIVVVNSGSTSADRYADLRFTDLKEVFTELHNIFFDKNS
ncbi:MAG: NAD-dependent deacetylase [Bacteroidetes bacterium]|nr:NAD-dependent deacetylase [Bacteroidota bacterium]